MKTVNSLLNLIRENGKAGTVGTGAVIYRWFYDSERYVVDCAEDSKSWDQFDTSQDAPYFGVWVNPTDLMTLSYCEGDWSLVECSSVQQYNAEIQNMIECYDAGYICKAIGPEHTTTYVQDRNQFFIKVQK